MREGITRIRNWTRSRETKLDIPIWQVTHFRRDVRESQFERDRFKRAREFVPAAFAYLPLGARPGDRYPRGPAAPHSGVRPRVNANPCHHQRPEAAPVGATPVPPSAYVDTRGRHCSRPRHRYGNPAGKRTRRSTRRQTSGIPGGSGTSRADGRTVSWTTAPARRSRSADTTAARRPTWSSYREHSTPVQRAAALNHHPGVANPRKLKLPCAFCPCCLSRHTPLRMRAPPACGGWHRHGWDRSADQLTWRARETAPRDRSVIYVMTVTFERAIRLAVGQWERVSVTRSSYRTMTKDDKIREF